MLWERNEYKTPQEKALRCHQGLVATIPSRLHYQGFPGSVHERLDAPPKPDIMYIIGATALLDRQTDGFLRNPVYTVDMVAHYFAGNDEEQLANHLLMQLEIFGQDVYNG